MRPKPGRGLEETDRFVGVAPEPQDHPRSLQVPLSQQVGNGVFGSGHRLDVGDVSGEGGSERGARLIVTQTVVNRRSNRGQRARKRHGRKLGQLKEGQRRVLKRQLVSMCLIDLCLSLPYGL